MALLLQSYICLALQIRMPPPERVLVLLQIANMLGVSHQAIHGFIKVARKRLQTEHKTALEDAFLDPAAIEPA